MLDNQQVTNKKPQDLAVTKSQGTIIRNGNGNSTPILRDSKCRYEKGMGLYKSGRVSIGSNGFFKVSGFEVDTEKVQCECPDYKSRKEACKHLFAAMLFVKNRGKQIVEDLPGFTWADEVRDMQPKTKDKVQTFAQLWEAENVPSLGQNGAYLERSELVIGIFINF